MNSIKWTCPTCDARNEDSFTETAAPMCSDCDSEFFWSDLMQPAEFHAFNLEAAREAKGEQ